MNKPFCDHLRVGVTLYAENDPDWLVTIPSVEIEHAPTEIKTISGLDKLLIKHEKYIYCILFLIIAIPLFCAAITGTKTVIIVCVLFIFILILSASTL